MPYYRHVGYRNARESAAAMVLQKHSNIVLSIGCDTGLTQTLRDSRGLNLHTTLLAQIQMQTLFFL